MADRPFSDPHKPGRIDVNGVEWWACDPYPTWYRWVEGELKVGDHAQWDDDEIISVEDTFDPDPSHSTQLDCLEANEVVALVQLFRMIPDGVTVFVGGMLYLPEDVPGMKSLAGKVQAAGEREDVKEYIDKNYGTEEE